MKLPRVPVSDNLVQTDTVVYRDLWKHIGKDLPKTAAGAAKLSPFDLPNTLKTALNALYSHYEGEFERWERAGIGVPPVFIVVCQNTAISKLVFEWIAGFERGDAEEGERAAFHAGHLELFRNYDDQGARLARPRTLLIDSRQIEAGDALDKGFRDAAGPEIEQFKRELAAREGAGAAQGEASESALLREVMNTVGRPGRLGEQIRCVVSVSMLTEGWDTNTVTHILGVRAFGTQLLCEQVVGRGLRRQSYDLNPETGLFDVEYADIMGIPFDFASSPQMAKPTKPKPVTRVHAIKERAELEIVFPRVSGYRRDLPSEKLEAVFTEDSRLEITPADIGPTSVVMEGIVGAGVTITPQVLERLRPSEISFNLAKHLLYTSFRDEDGFPKQHLFPQIQRLARRWLDEGYLVTKGVPVGAILYQDQLARAAEKIDIACTRASEGRILAVLDPYNPKGSTRHVNFITSKPCWKTGAQPPKSHISHVVLDSELGGAARADARDPSARAGLRQEPGARLRDSLSRSRRHAALPARLPGPARRWRRRAAQPRARGEGHQGRERQGQGPDDARTLGSWRQRARRLRPLGIRRISRLGRDGRGFRRAGRSTAQEGFRLMARSPRSSNGKPSKQVDALKHDEATRRNIPTAEMESFFRRDEDASPMPPKHYPRARPLAEGETRTPEEPSQPELIWNGAKITITDEQMKELAETGTLTLSDAQLVWRGKDRQDWTDLVVNVPPLYIQEKIHPKAIIDDLKRRTAEKREAEADAPDLFADFNGIAPEQRAEFYQHDQHWSNRMILGDSLQVMASLAERESLKGKVQCIYFDPPYGIKFNSNWQVSTQIARREGRQADRHSAASPNR